MHAHGMTERCDIYMYVCCECVCESVCTYLACADQLWWNGVHHGVILYVCMHVCMYVCA